MVKYSYYEIIIYLLAKEIKYIFARNQDYSARKKRDTNSESKQLNRNLCLKFELEVLVRIHMYFLFKKILSGYVC